MTISEVLRCISEERDEDLFRMTDREYLDREHMIRQIFAEVLEAKADQAIIGAMQAQAQGVQYAILQAFHLGMRCQQKLNIPATRVGLLGRIEPDMFTVETAAAAAGGK